MTITSAAPRDEARTSSVGEPVGPGAAGVAKAGVALGAKSSWRMAKRPRAVIASSSPIARSASTITIYGAFASAVVGTSRPEASPPMGRRDSRPLADCDRPVRHALLIDDNRTRRRRLPDAGVERRPERAGPGQPPKTRCSIQRGMTGSAGGLFSLIREPTHMACRRFFLFAESNDLPDAAAELVG